MCLCINTKTEMFEFQIWIYILHYSDSFKKSKTTMEHHLFWNLFQPKEQTQPSHHLHQHHNVPMQETVQ
jgi:hypothetical protein